MFGALLVMTGTTRSEDSFRDPNIIRPPGLDKAGFNVLVGCSVCVGLVIIAVMVAICYHVYIKPRRREFHLTETTEL
ncbi:Hypp5266 [Branchiostoma lanceolatum]|uniref:Hypp5266 protein n=1 Tax=Branchiostoma lanceolatum TaxID=7740 RepID=A0A8K0AEQ9_BRALA|nr:Hypp5266 [Branchiostoma lanceolatum]